MGFWDFLRSKSEQSIEKISEHITSTSMDIANKCGVDVVQNQNVTFENTGTMINGSVKIKQSTTVKSQCFSNLSMQTMLQNSIINKIEQELKYNGVAIADIGGRNTVSKTHIEDTVKNNITFSAVQSNYINIKQNQSVDLKNSGFMYGGSLDVSQGADAFAMSVLKAANDSKIFNLVDTAIKQNQSITASFFDAILNNLFWVVIVIIIIGALLIGGPRIIGMFMSDETKSGGDWNPTVSYDYDEIY